jgi:hypothetical protein
MQTRKKLKVFKIGNGKEDCSCEFQGIFKTHGISHQNFHNIHIITKWCGQMGEQNYHRSYSMYATKTTCLKYKVLGGSYQHSNILQGLIVPHKSLDQVTPKEAYSRKKPFVKNLWVFGCEAYIHKPIEQGQS